MHQAAALHARAGHAVARRANATWIEVDVASPRSGRILARVMQAQLPASVTHGHRQGGGTSGSWHAVRYDLTRFKGQHVRLIFRDGPTRHNVPVAVDIARVRITTR